jgi:hypothetical protein
MAACRIGLSDDRDNNNKISHQRDECGHRQNMFFFVFLENWFSLAFKKGLEVALVYFFFRFV